MLLFAGQAEAFTSGETGPKPRESVARDFFRSLNPALITERSRDPLIDDDFMRITFVPGSVDVTTPGRPSALRAFFGSTRFYQPALSVKEIADFNGFAPGSDIDLVAMRCRPRPDQSDPYLATWPTLAKMIIIDLADQHFACPPVGGNPENIAYCLAENYTDTPVQPVVTALIHALKFGQRLFKIKNGDFLLNDYGIGPDHSGLGFVVRGLPVPLNAFETLEQSVVPEYLLKNINLADANCRCIRVAPYKGRDDDLLPAALVWKRGKLGSGGLCSSYVKRLPHDD